MVGLAAAFLADRLGIQADNYVLCNPPLSLVDKNGTEDWVQRYTTNGRARAAGSAMAPASTPSPTSSNCSRPAPAASRPPNGWINTWPTRSRPTAAPASRRQRPPAMGARWPPHPRPRHPLLQPHDQVISADSVQGIGWRGMSADEIAKTGGAGVFAQRVFAHAYPVGAAGGKDYDFWAERNKRDPDPYPGSFWIPPSPRPTMPSSRASPPTRASSARCSACSRRPSSSSPPGRSRPGSMPTRAQAGRSRSTPRRCRSPSCPRPGTTGRR